MSNDTDQNEDQDKLTAGQQIANLLFGADFLFRLILAVPWTIQLWIVQSGRAKAKGQRFIPQPPKSLLFYDIGCQAQDILAAYHVHNMHFGAKLEIVAGKAELAHAVLVPATQFDYADAILYQHGIPMLSPAGSKRGQNVGQPRDYGDRQPARQQRPKLGKTYR